MTVNIGQISNPSIVIKPSKKLQDYLSNLKITSDIPTGIKKFVFKNKTKDDGQRRSEKIRHLINDEDIKFIDSLKLNTKVEDITNEFYNKKAKNSIGKDEKYLNLQDLYWLHDYIQKENSNNNKKIYLHELIEGSDVILPKNVEIPRNEELEKRCLKLKAAQENKDYNQMTKNVDSFRRRLPEDTIGYQLRQMNRHLIAIAQFIFSVAAGFAFGFIGVELLIGNLDFGFRLLLGIICALVIALAELYFLAKRLNEDMQFEDFAMKKNKGIKVD